MAQLQIQDNTSYEQDLEDLFNMFDLEDTGFIKYEDLKICIWVLNFNEESCTALLEKSGTEPLSMAEFIQFFKEVESVNFEAETVLSAFQHFDATKDGLMPFSHLLSILTDFGTRMPPKDASKLVKQVTEGKDIFNYPAFIKRMADMGLLKRPDQLFEQLEGIAKQKAQKRKKKKSHKGKVLGKKQKQRKAKTTKNAK